MRRRRRRCEEKERVGIRGELEELL